MSANRFSLPGQGSGKLLRLARQSKHIGTLDNPSGTGSTVGDCGDSIQVSLRIEGKTITEIKVMPRGCKYTVACADAVGELARGRDLDQALELEPEDVATLLGGLPQDHLHCARLAVNTLGEAIADYYRKTTHSESKG